MAEDLIRDGPLLILDGHVTVMPDRFRHYGTAVFPWGADPGPRDCTKRQLRGASERPPHQARRPEQVTGSDRHALRLRAIRHEQQTLMQMNTKQLDGLAVIAGAIFTMTR
jgi:hypothetical protein